MKTEKTKLREFEYDDLIENIEKDLKQIKKQRRKDYGAKRPTYSMALPPKYRSKIMCANKRGISFNLSVEEFESITACNCVYCGTSNKIGVDRIDSSIGYELDNCQPCCGTCNLMKHTNTNVDFLKHITKIFNFVNYQK